MTLQFEVGKVYMDRRYEPWRVIATDGPRGRPIIALALIDSHIRSFYPDGRYNPDRDDEWDLIKEVENHGKEKG